MKKIKMLFLILLVINMGLFAGGKKEEPSDNSKPAEIEFWHAMSGSRIQLIEGIVQDFTEMNPDTLVKVQYTGSYNDTLNKVKTAVKANNAPHVFHSYEIGTLGLIHSGIISPLDDMASKYDRPITWEDFFVPVQSYYKYDGKHYSMPFNSSTPLFYYNKTLFKDAGLDPENPPKTYSEVYEACKILRESGIDTPITWNLHSWYFEEMLCLQNAPIVNNSNGRSSVLPTKVLINEEPGKNILEWWIELFNEGYYLNVGPGWDNHRAAFGSGKVAMVLSSSSDVNLFTKAFKDKGWELGTGFIPRYDGAKGGVAIGGGSLWMTSGHSKKEEIGALKLVQYISSDTPQIAWHKGTGYFPVRKTAMDQLKKEGWFDENPNYLTAFNQLLDSPESLNTAGGLMGTFTQTRDIIQNAIQECYEGKDIQTTLDEAALKANEALAEWNDIIQ